MIRTRLVGEHPQDDWNQAQADRLRDLVFEAVRMRLVDADEETCRRWEEGWQALERMYRNHDPRFFALTKTPELESLDTITRVGT